MVRTIADVLVLGGILILVLSLRPLTGLVRRTPPGRIRQAWQLVSALVALFLAGYLFYEIGAWGRPAAFGDLVVPVIFFFGAIFVWMTAGLAVETVGEMQRVALLEQQNITDPLTGAYNRRFLDRRLDEEISKALRYRRALSVMLIDIDDFKQVNDQLGHPVGDQVLIGLVDRMAELIRESDVLARFGGDELVVLTPDSDLMAAAALAERLRAQVENSRLHIRHANDPAFELSLTVSIGVSGMPAGPAGGAGCSGADLIARADEAVYRAKSAGKNRVAVG